MSLTELVAQKLNEYGIQIFRDHDVEDEHVYYAENMIVFVNDKEKSMSVTFQATTKPERSATLALILNQIRKADIHIMEPFIFNEKNEFISGQKAYELIEQSDKVKVMQEYNKQRYYAHILDQADCHEC